MKHFFEWGEMPIDDEIAADVSMTITQPKGELYYNRDYGAGVPEIENSVSLILMQVGTKFMVVQALAVRNDRVSDGTNGPDRRVATSQSVIDIIETESGVEVEVLYVSLGGTQQPRRIATPVGGI